MILADFLVVDSVADQRQSGIVGRPASAAAGISTTSAATFRIDPFRFQQQLDRFRLGRDCGSAGVGTRQYRLRVEHHYADLSQEIDLLAKFFLAIFEGTDAINDVIDSLTELVLGFRKLPSLFGVFFGLDRRLGLFGDAGFFSQIHFAFEDLQNFQNDGWRQTAARFAAGSGAPLRRIDQILRPTIHCVRPEFRLRDRQAVLFLEVVAELPQAADDVLCSHVVEHRFE